MLIAIKILVIALIVFAAGIIGISIYFTEKLEKAYGRKWER